MRIDFSPHYNTMGCQSSRVAPATPPHRINTVAEYRAWFERDAYYHDALALIETVLQCDLDARLRCKFPAHVRGCRDTVGMLYDDISRVIAARYYYKITS
jgi:hypothetical protein